jgi:hypothetical protein
MIAERTLLDDLARRGDEFAGFGSFSPAFLFRRVGAPRPTSGTPN